MAELEERLFFKGLNLDDEPRSLEQGDYLLPTRNIRIYSTGGSQFGLVTNIKGNVKISYQLPSGRNRCIGARADKETGNIYYFIWNEFLDHSILRFVPNNTGGVIQRIFQDPILGFNKKKRINHANLVDGKILYWTDADTFPKKLNVEKAIEDKQRSYKIYFGSSCSVSQTYTFSVFNPNGSLNSTWTSPAISGSDAFDVSHQVSTAFVGGIPATLVANGALIDFKFDGTAVGEYTLTVTASVSLNQVLALADNFYPKPYVQDFVDRLKYPRKAEPKALFMYDPAVKTNRVRDRVFQFSIQYIYDDNEPSTWSPISTIASFNSECTSIPSSAYNFIRIDFTEDRLNNDSSRSAIKYVGIAFREHNNGKPKLITYLDPADFGIGQNYYDFYNDGIYKGISDEEYNQLFSFLPQVCGATEFAGNRLIDGDVTEGYDNVNIDAEVNVGYTNKTVASTFNVAGNVFCENYFLNTLQPIWYQSNAQFSAPPANRIVYGGLSTHISPAVNNQVTHEMGTNYNQEIPLSGITVYLAATNYNAQTKQPITTSDASIQNQQSGVYYMGDSIGENYSTSQYKRDFVKSKCLSGDVYSRFVIEGVRPGVYVMRIASNLSTGDDLSDNKRYQFSSMPTKEVGGTVGSECIIEVIDDGAGNYRVVNLSTGVTHFGNSTTDAEVEPSTVYDLANAAAPLAIAGKSDGIVGYIKDGEGNTTAPALFADAIIEKGVERSLVKATFASSLEYYTTDHNGFFFFATTNTPVTIINTTICSEVFAITPLSLPTTIKRITRNQSTAPYPTAENPNTGSGFEGVKTLIVRHSASPIDNITKYARTNIEGNVFDSTGTPMPGIPVVITHGQFGYTDINGHFSIPVYGEESSFCMRTDDIIFSVEDASCNFGFVTNRINFSIQIGNNTSGTPPPYDYYHHYNAGNFTGIFIAFITNTSFKRGFDGEFALIYYDRGNRSGASNANKKTRVHINFYTEKDLTTGQMLPTGVPQLSWLIRHNPPDWATHYQWARTKNLQVSSYLQWVGNRVEYCSDAPVNGTAPFPLPLVYGNAAIRYMRIELSNFVLYQGRHKNSLVAYTWQKGDRIRFISNFGTLFSDYFDYEIEQANEDSNGNYIYIKYDSSLPDISTAPNNMNGALFEIYTPKPATDEKLFFEFGETYRILEMAGIKYHQGQSQDQDPNNPYTTPATGVFTNGDAYYRTRVIPYTNATASVIGIAPTIDDSSISDFFLSNDQSIGRINIVNQSAARIRREKVLRFSGEYVKDTKINGLSWNRFQDQEQIQKGDGAITKLQMAGRVLLAIQPSAVNSVYINENEFRDAGGNSSIIKSDSFLGSINPLQGLYGTINPESVQEYEGRVRFWDGLHGAVIRYSNDGLTPISMYKTISYFSNKSKELLAVGSDEIYAFGFFDPKNNEYGICFRDLAQTSSAPSRIKEEVMTFNENTNRWTSPYDYFPEQFSFSGMETVLMKDGELWVNERNPVHGNFCGVQYPSQITLVSNQNSGKVRQFMALSEESTHVWSCPSDGDISVPASVKYPNGMASRLLKTKFRNIHAVWYSPFDKDLNSPNLTGTDALLNGRPLLGHVIKVTLLNNDTEPVQMKAANIRYNTVEFSKK